MSAVSGVILVAAMTTATTESADAYTYYRSSKPGKVVVLDQVQGTHDQTSRVTIAASPAFPVRCSPTASG